MARTPLFSIPCNGNSPAFPQTAASAPPWTARAYTAAPRKGRRTVRLEPFRYRRRKRFQQILPAQGRADGLGAVVAPGRRAEGGQSFFFYIHALTVGSASFRVKTPFPAVHPGAGRRFLPTSRAGGAHFPASLRLVSRRAANSSKGTVPSRQKLTQFFLFIW